MQHLLAATNRVVELNNELEQTIKQRDALVEALQMYGLGYTDDELKQLAKAVSLMGEICPYQARREIKRRKALATIKGGRNDS